RIGFRTLVVTARKPANAPEEDDFISGEEDVLQGFDDHHHHSELDDSDEDDDEDDEDDDEEYTSDEYTDELEDDESEDPSDSEGEGERKADMTGLPGPSNASKIEDVGSSPATIAIEPAVPIEPAPIEPTPMATVDLECKLFFSLSQDSLSGFYLSVATFYS